MTHTERELLKAYFIYKDPDCRVEKVSLCDQEKWDCIFLCLQACV